jgi:hypothetical protein
MGAPNLTVLWVSFPEDFSAGSDLDSLEVNLPAAGLRVISFEDVGNAVPDPDGLLLFLLAQASFVPLLPLDNAAVSSVNTYKRDKGLKNPAAIFGRGTGLMLNLHEAALKKDILYSTVLSVGGWKWGILHRSSMVLHLFACFLHPLPPSLHKVLWLGGVLERLLL